MQKAIVVANYIGKKKPFILKACGTGLFLGWIIITGTPREYAASIFTVPESRTYVIQGEEDSSLPVGLSGKRMRDAIMPSHYPQVVGSTAFVIALFDIPVTLSGGETMTLAEYLSAHQRSPWWSAFTALPQQVIGGVSRLFKNSETSGRPETEAQGRDIDVFRLTRRQAAVIGSLRGRIAVDIDTKRRTVTLNVRMQDPLVAAIVADSVSARLQAYIKAYRSKKEFDNLAYVEGMRKQAYEAYCMAQEAYALFVDRNHNLSGKVMQGELRKRWVDKNQAYAHYAKTSKQVQQVKFRAGRERPVYAVIEPAKVPLHPVAPQKMKIIIGSILFSLAAGCSWLWCKEKYKALFTHLKQSK